MKKYQHMFTLLAVVLTASAANVARADVGENETAPPESISDNTSKELPPPPPPPPSTDYTGTSNGTVTPAPVELPTFHPPTTGETKEVPPPAVDTDNGVKAVPAW